MNSSLNSVLLNRRILNVNPDARPNPGPSTTTNDLPGRRANPGPHDSTPPVIRGGHHFKLPAERQPKIRESAHKLGSTYPTASSLGLICLTLAKPSRN